MSGPPRKIPHTSRRAGALPSRRARAIQSRLGRDLESEMIVCQAYGHPL